jgi:hypothetical protein
MLSINLDIGDVVLENSWDVNLCTPTISMQLHQMLCIRLLGVMELSGVLTRCR